MLPEIVANHRWMLQSKVIRVPGDRAFSNGTEKQRSIHADGSTHPCCVYVMTARYGRTCCRHELAATVLKLVKGSLKVTCTCDEIFYSILFHFIPSTVDLQQAPILVLALAVVVVAFLYIVGITLVSLVLVQRDHFEEGVEQESIVNSSHHYTGASCCLSACQPALYIL